MVTAASSTTMASSMTIGTRLTASTYSFMPLIICWPCYLPNTPPLLPQDTRPPLLHIAKYGSYPHIQKPLRKIDHKQKSTADRKSTRLNSSHVALSYAVLC